MNRTRTKVDTYSVTWANERHKESIAYYRRRLKSVDEDPKRKERIAASECAMCHYDKSCIGAAVCTFSPCAFCDERLYSGNSNIDLMCTACAAKAGLCKHCGADIDLKNRRKRVLPVPTEVIEL